MKGNLNAITLRVIVYYLITVVGFHLLLLVLPEAMDYFPVGGIDRLNDELSAAQSDRGLVLGIMESGVAIKVLEFRSLTLLITLIAIIIFTVPIAWVYDATQSIRKHRHAPLIETLYLLPIIVATVVIIVQNSIALAFSLVGIVAAVRFRNTLKSPTDAVFVFAALSIGLAGGVSEIGIAGVASMVFSLTVLGLRYFRVVKHEQYSMDSDPSEIAGEANDHHPHQ
ncbi:MAG: DUF4956 domain-containing protein [Gammaproteobacteria bacterium]|nr:DUF4956 domain-containing protein [Pseudomonadales bacterium]MCP5348688.1 DUF4956 domain-containing protein [Pseudomonadales bacterium]